MIDINLIRTNPELVKENIRKKFQDKKLPLVDEVLELDTKRRTLIAEGDALRASRNVLSKKVGECMKAGNKEEAEQIKAQVKADADRLLAIEKEGEEVEAALKKAMMAIITSCIWCRYVAFLLLFLFSVVLLNLRFRST